MSGFKVASILSKFALLIAVTNGVFFMCGLASSYWQSGTSSTGGIVGYGLWMRCLEENSTLSCLGFDNFDGQGAQVDSGVNLSRGLVLTSFICVWLTAATCFVYIYTTKLHTRWMALVVSIFAYSSVMFCLGGLIVYGRLVLQDFKLDWSFAMAVLALILNLAMAALLTVDLIKFGKNEEIRPASPGIEEPSNGH